VALKLLDKTVPICRSHVCAHPSAAACARRSLCSSVAASPSRSRAAAAAVAAEAAGDPWASAEARQPPAGADQACAEAGGEAGGVGAAHAGVRGRGERVRSCAGRLRLGDARGVAASCRRAQPSASSPSSLARANHSKCVRPRVCSTCLCDGGRGRLLQARAANGQLALHRRRRRPQGCRDVCQAHWWWCVT